MKTDKEILQKADDYGTYWQELWQELRMTKKQQSESIIAFARGYQACQYDLQLMEQPALVVPDEDIEKWANKVQPARGGYKSDYIFAAKAMRDGKIKSNKTVK